MDKTPAEQELDKLRKIAKQRKRIEEGEPATIAAALNTGARVTDVAEAVGRTREHVRRIARAHGIEPSK